MLLVVRHTVHMDNTRFDMRAERRRVTATEVAERVVGLAAPLVVITGGEPLVQADALAPLVLACRRAGRDVEVETNGTIAPSTALTRVGVRWNVSPKLANAGIPRERRIRPEALHAFVASGSAVFKFVVTARSDLDEIAALERDLGLTQIWVMPEGQASDQIVPLMRRLADEVIARGWNLTSRLHVLLWEAERGR